MVGVKQDYNKAAELFEKACNGKNIESCSILGVFYESGQGV